MKWQSTAMSLKRRMIRFKKSGHLIERNSTSTILWRSAQMAKTLMMEIWLDWWQRWDKNNTTKISDSNESQIPHFSEFCSRLLKLSIWEKIPDRPLKKPLKLIRDISKKVASSRQNSTQIALFLSIIPALLFFRAKLKLFIFAQFRFFSSL